MGPQKFKDRKLLDAGPKPPGKFIKGRQVKSGMLKAKGDTVLFMDADLATPLKYIKEALTQIDSGNEVAICVRNLQKSHKGLRKIISDSVKAIFPLQTIDGWGFDMEILAIARKKGYTIGLIQVPDWQDIKEGSKISGSSPIKASLQTFGDLLRIRWQIIRGRYKK